MRYDEQYEEVQRAYQSMKEQNKGQNEDEFSEYLVNLIAHSPSHESFTNVRLQKEVDESWVKAIEDTIPAIRNCILNPRKFIEEEREVVNIAMARNITPESVRHLLAHSNYIDEYRKDGTVIPNRILNIYKEESMNTYENRFICTLVAELLMFINKRYKGLTARVKDEFGTNFNYSSVIDNYYEVIDYSLKIKITEKQSQVEADVENADIYQRIDTLFSQINMLATTEFIQTMKRFPQVTLPVVKTNAIQKNKNYNKCYQLWNFIHTYTQAGYKVDIMQQSPNLTTQMQSDINQSICSQYLMLQNYLQRVDTLQPAYALKKNTIGISNIRQALEEIVAGSELSDENLRRLVMTELQTIQRRRKKEKEDAMRLTKKRKQSKGKKL